MSFNGRISDYNEPSYREATVATSPGARERQRIRAKIIEHARHTQVYISAHDLLEMTDSQVQEALGLQITMVADSDHEQTAETLDGAALAETEFRKHGGACGCVTCKKA